MITKNLTIAIILLCFTFYLVSCSDDDENTVSNSSSAENINAFFADPANTGYCYLIGDQVEGPTLEGDTLFFRMNLGDLGDVYDDDVLGRITIVRPVDSGYREGKYDEAYYLYNNRMYWCEPSLFYISDANAWVSTEPPFDEEKKEGKEDGNGLIWWYDIPIVLDYEADDTELFPVALTLDGNLKCAFEGYTSEGDIKITLLAIYGNITLNNYNDNDD